MIGEAVDSVLARVTQLGSLNGRVGAGLRHETADVRRTLSDSYRALLDMCETRGYSVSEDDGPQVLPAREADFPWIELPWPTNAARITGVDVNTGGGFEDWRTADPIAWERRFQPHTGTMLGRYTTRQPPAAVASATVTAGAVLLLPADGSESGQYLLHYRPTLPVLSDGTHVFVYQAGSWLDWHVADTLCRLIGVRDADAKGRLDAAKDMRAQAASEIPRITEVMPEHTEGAVRDWNYRAG